MKSMKIKTVIQVGDEKVELSGEFPKLGMTWQIKEKFLNKMLVRAVKMLEVVDG